MPIRHRHTIQELPARVSVFLPVELKEYLHKEAKRLSEETGKCITPQKIIRALVVSYRERREAGLITHPDD
jgi:hypothetical protein